MARVRLTKNELKKQKDDLARFTRFLPTLELKKQQLIAEVQRVQAEVAALDRQVQATEAEVTTWVDVFAEEVDWPSVLVVQEIRTGCLRRPQSPGGPSITPGKLLPQARQCPSSVMFHSDSRYQSRPITRPPHSEQ